MSSISITYANQDIVDSGFHFKDPVGTYNGQPISSHDFLSFLKESSNLTEEAFSSESIETVKEFLYAYVMYQHFSSEIKMQSLYQSEDVKEALDILSHYILANIYELKVDYLNLDEIKEAQDRIASDFKLSLLSLQLISEKELKPQTQEQLRDDPELQKKLTLRYRDILVLADLSQKMNIEATKEYQDAYRWAEQSYLADLYVKNYLTEILDEDEMDAMFNHWLSEQQFMEYKASHIYFDEEQVAQDVLLKLQNKDLTFEEAVILYSKDLATNEYEGKMGRGGWVSFPQKDHPVAMAVASLKVADMTDEVIVGIYGYHIIRLDDMQITEGPSYVYDKAFKEEMWRDNKRKALYEQFKKDNTITLF